MSDGLCDDIEMYQEFVASSYLLMIPFETVTEYLELLELTANIMADLKSRACFYLAAAVSDFYLPFEEVRITLVKYANF